MRRRRNRRDHTIRGGLLVLSIAAGITGSPPAASGQTTTDITTRARLATIATAATGTPGGRGLLDVAIAEARTALAQAVLAEKAAGDLAAMRRYGAAILHALDPAQQASGPGLGYGLRRAVQEVILEIQATASADSRPDIARLTPRALTAAQEVLGRTVTLVGLAQRLQGSSDAAQAATLSRQMRETAAAVLAGPNFTLTRTPRAQITAGGLHAVKATLAIIIAGRDGTLPSSFRRTPEAR
jgi:hypothetical protein